MLSMVYKISTMMPNTVQAIFLRSCHCLYFQGGGEDLYWSDWAYPQSDRLPHWGWLCSDCLHKYSLCYLSVCQSKFLCSLLEPREKWIARHWSSCIEAHTSILTILLPPSSVMTQISAMASCLFLFLLVASLADSTFFFSPCEVTYAPDSCLGRVYLSLGLRQKTLEEKHKSLAPFPFFPSFY